ncbi:MAG: glycosyltransferase, partial [Opitutales bacterium]
MKAVLIFDPQTGGHHPGYLLNLLRYVALHEMEVMLQILVAPDFPEKHGDVVAFAQERLPERVKWWTLNSYEVEAYEETESPARRGLLEWHMLQRHGNRIPHDEIFLMYADFITMPLALGRPFTAPLGGILFRQTPHYQRVFKSRLNLSEQTRSVIKGALLRRALTHPQLRMLLSLDSYLPDYLKHCRGGHKLGLCPDPVQQATGASPPSLAEAAFPPEAKVLLCFGVISARKGFGNFLEASSRMSGEDLARIAFWVVGPSREPGEESRVRSALEKIRAKGGYTFREDRFVSDAEIGPYFQCAHGAAMPYQKHLGMSAVLVRAAVANIPALAADYGLLGHLVDDQRLGVSFDPANPAAIASALRDFAHGKVAFDKASAAKLAEINRMEPFGEALMRATGVLKKGDTLPFNPRAELAANPQTSG